MAADPLAGVAGLDTSWGAGLSLATDHRLTYGRSIMWTYGPLGFLSIQPTVWIGSLGAITLVSLLLVRIATAAALLLGARRTFGTAVALVLAIVAGSVAPDLNATAVLFVVAPWALRSGIIGRRALLIGLAIGALSALELLDKISGGVAFTIMSGARLVSLPGPRWRPVAAGGDGRRGGVPGPVGGNRSAAGRDPRLRQGGCADQRGLLASHGRWLVLPGPGSYGALLILVAGAWAAWTSMRPCPTR